MTPTGASAFALATAWGGALLFAASLSFFLFSYFVRFTAAPGQAPIVSAVLADIGLFSVFALHHSVFARTRLKAWVTRLMPPELERSLYTWTSSLLLVAVCWWWRPVPGVLYRLDGFWWVVGATTQATGLALTALGSQALDVLDLAGLRPVLRTRKGVPVAHVPLMTSGVYAVVRHPLYFGWCLLVCGSPAMTATRAVFAVVSCTYLALAIPWEERSLIATFGPDYEAYRAKVRWRMIPGVY